jgi:hypothetical protein
VAGTGTLLDPAIVTNGGAYDAGTYTPDAYDLGGNAKSVAASALLRPSLSFTSTSRGYQNRGVGTIALALGFDLGEIYADGIHEPGTYNAGVVVTKRGSPTLALAAASATGAVYDDGVYDPGLLPDANLKRGVSAQTLPAGTLGYSRLGIKRAATSGADAAATLALAVVSGKEGRQGAALTLAAALSATSETVSPRSGAGVLTLAVQPATVAGATLDPDIYDAGTYASGEAKLGAGSAAATLTTTLAPVALPGRSGAGGGAAAVPTLAGSGARAVRTSPTLTLPVALGPSGIVLDGVYDPDIYATTESGSKGVATSAAVPLAPTLGTAGAKAGAGAGGTIAVTPGFVVLGTSNAALSLLVFPSGAGIRAAAGTGAGSAVVAPTATGRRDAPGTATAPLAATFGTVGGRSAAGDGAAPIVVDLAALGLERASAGAVVAATPTLTAGGTAERSGSGLVTLPVAIEVGSKGFLALVLGTAAGGIARLAGAGDDLRPGDLSMATVGEGVSAPGFGSVRITVDLTLLALPARRGSGTAGLGATLASAGHAVGAIVIPPGIPLRGTLRRAIALRGLRSDPVRLTGTLSNRVN